MEKIDLKIGETFTNTDGDIYETLASPNTDCNLCKGCVFLQLVPNPDKFVGKFMNVCAAPDILCCKPDRIFKQIN